MIKKILIFTATYNEFPNIKTLLKKINSLKINLDILIVDDNSKDGTLAFLTEYSKKNKNLKLIIREKKLGLDTAHKIAYRYAQKNNYNYLVTLDADLSHEPKEIRKFINLLDNNSFIIGSRYIKGGKCDLKGFRFLISFFGNYFIKFFLNINCNEFTTSYRAFNIDKLKRLNMNKIKSKGYSFFMEAIFLINFLNIKIIEIPIHFKLRHSGHSKISKIEIFRTLINLLRLKFFYK
jgi:glycosyltransferase involved in cell wall biosynthesis